MNEIVTKDFKFVLTNPANGEVMEYQGDPADVFGFADDIERQLRELKKQLKEHFEYKALIEKEKGLLTTNTYYIESKFGKVKIELYQDFSVDAKLATRIKDTDPEKYQELVREKVYFKLDKNSAKKTLSTIDQSEIKQLVEEIYTRTPFTAKASFIKGG